MCREMENMRKAERIEIAKRMLVSGKLTYEDIAAFTDLPLEEIKTLAVQKTASQKKYFSLQHDKYMYHVVGSLFFRRHYNMFFSVETLIHWPANESVSILVCEMGWLISTPDFSIPRNLLVMLQHF